MFYRYTKGYTLRVFISANYRSGVVPALWVSPATRCGCPHSAHMVPGALNSAEVFTSIKKINNLLTLCHSTVLKFKLGPPPSSDK